MPITTSRLLIRACEPGDGKLLNEALLESNADLRPWMPWARTAPPTVAESEENIRQSCAKFILREDLRMQIIHRESGKYLGGTGLHRFNLEHGIFEIGYWIRSSESGKGYVTETTNALTRFCFGALGARRVTLHINAGNTKSTVIADRLGFKFEGCLRNQDTYSDPTLGATDTNIYARLSLEGLPALDVSW